MVGFATRGAVGLGRALRNSGERWEAAPSPPRHLLEVSRKSGFNSYRGSYEHLSTNELPKNVVELPMDVMM